MKYEWSSKRNNNWLMYFIKKRMMLEKSGENFSLRKIE